MTAGGPHRGRIQRRASAMRATLRGLRRRRDVREALATIAGARGAHVVLVYHRIAERDRPRYEIVPTVPRELFRRHLEILGEVGRIAPLATLLRDHHAADAGPRFALTFDDDLGTHATEVLPVVRDLGLAATFFLSGRPLHGLGGYWFERLESLVAERGLEGASSSLGVPASTAVELAHRCEADERALAAIEERAPFAPCTLDERGIRSLIGAGMTIGFHTLRHPVLPALEDHGLRHALTDGRDELGVVAGRPLTWFAYPHGKFDSRVMDEVRRAGFSDAWTTRPSTVGTDGDPLARGRWDPLPVSPDRLVIRLGELLRRAAGRPV